MDVIKEWWVFIISGATGLMWLMRLEARSLSNEREVRRLAEQRKEDLENSRRSREDTNAMLAEIRADVKAILTSKAR